jgi:aspartyl-tRNA(Asn)/glutamyl-tRNA(Gln) amidotransferase subunit A
MKHEDLCWMSAVELARGIRDKRFSPVEVVTAVLERMERVNRRINAYVTVVADAALAEAERAERVVMSGGDLGPLHGVPVSIKDLIFTKGIRTTMGSRLLQDYVPDEDAVAVSRLKKAGAIVLGKTNAPEFGFKPMTDNAVFGTTCSPWNERYTPGGSSGGAAAAVAAGLGPLALGSDGGGSIRIPSSCCGVFGIKPHLGRVPRYPTFRGGEVITHEGPITRTVEDAALMLDVMAGPHWGDGHSLPAPRTSFTEDLDRGVRGLKIAWSADLGYAAVEPEVRAICEQAVKALSVAGAEVEEASPGFENPEVHAGTLFGADGLAALSVLGTVDQLEEKLEPLTGAMLFFASELRASEYAKAMFAKEELSIKMGEFMRTYDLLATPTLPTPPLPTDYNDPVGFLRWAAFTFPFNLTGQPAVSVPAGRTGIGLPVGLQLVGRPHDEVTVLRAAAALERARSWLELRPPLG